MRAAFPFITAFQAVALLLALAIGFLRPQLGSRRFRTVSRCLSWIAQRQRLSVALVGFLAVLVSVVISLFLGMPQPRAHDEFSYLLAADTFSRGRLANPTHPMWVHFESFHINQTPTYASKYPPAQGLVLALGQVLAGYPIVGVWLSIGLACAAVCWMLQAWVPGRWALVGGLFAASHQGILWSWGQTYWGGAVAMFGGALVFGALRRIISRPSIGTGLIMGVGLAVLANSRPFEGLVVSVPVAVALFASMAGKAGPPMPVTLRRTVLPIVIVLVPTIVAMGFYNLRVAGAVTQMPYQLHETMYASRPLFLWQQPRSELTYRHDIMRAFYKGSELTSYAQQSFMLRLIKATVDKMKRLWGFYLGFLLTISLVALPWMLKNRWTCFALLTCGLLTAASLQVRWFHPHYMAPITGLVVLLVVEGLRHVRQWRWHGRRIGSFIASAIVVIFVLSPVPLLVQKMRANPNPWYLQRARIIAKLKQDGERHLVIVRYGPTHSVNSEWVYNEADIDGARVVWAREMDTARNRKLLDYFRDRHVWLLDVNGRQAPLKLLPYPTALAPRDSALEPKATESNS